MVNHDQSGFIYIFQMECISDVTLDTGYEKDLSFLVILLSIKF